LPHPLSLLLKLLLLSLSVLLSDTSLEGVRHVQPSLEKHICRADHELNIYSQHASEIANDTPVSIGYQACTKGIITKERDKG